MIPDKTILHFDGDSFFASVEQMMNYRLRGKPLVTGGERGAITSASLEAKKMGIGRGVSLRDAKKICPSLIVVPGNYLTYSIFASRMYSIVREWTPIIEEYSIDECFADITGLDKVFKKSYEEIALDIKKKIETSLGVTFGVGMGTTKVLAKVGSKHRKPAGFTSINKDDLHKILGDLPCGKIWGIGPATSITLARLGVYTALEFINKSEGWIEYNKITKPLRETWLELQGYFVKELGVDGHLPLSIIKSRTFRPPSSNQDFLFSQLSKNVESACTKMRRYGLLSGEIRFYLKTQEFTYKSYGISMSLPTSSPSEILHLIQKYFNNVYKPNVLYRATGVTLRSFTREGQTTDDLFGKSEDNRKQIKVFETVDNISRRFGESCVFLGSSMQAMDLVEDDHQTHQKILEIPMLGRVK